MQFIYFGTVDITNALIAIIAVMGIMAMIIILVLASLLAKAVNQNRESNTIYPNAAPNPVVQDTVLPVYEESPKKFTSADITDEDMMVAALVATIDYANETKKDVRLLSIRQIG